MAAHKIRKIPPQSKIENRKSSLVNRQSSIQPPSLTSFDLTRGFIKIRNRHSRIAPQRRTAVRLVNDEPKPRFKKLALPDKADKRDAKTPRVEQISCQPCLAGPSTKNRRNSPHRIRLKRLHYPHENNPRIPCFMRNPPPRQPPRTALKSMRIINRKLRPPQLILVCAGYPQIDPQPMLLHIKINHIRPAAPPISDSKIGVIATSKSRFHRN